MGWKFDASIRRTWANVRNYRPSLWGFMYAAYLKAFNREKGNEIEQVVKDAVWTLQNWPLSQIQWPVNNSRRLDITWNPVNARGGQRQINELLPYDELPMLNWNQNPFIVTGGTGYTEHDGVSYLLPYWLAVYFNLI